MPAHACMEISHFGRKHWGNHKNVLYISFETLIYRENDTNEFIQEKSIII